MGSYIIGKPGLTSGTDIESLLSESERIRKSVKAVTIGLISNGSSSTSETHEHLECRHIHDDLTGFAIKHLAKKAMDLDLLPRPVRGSLKRLGRKKRKNVPLTPAESRELDRCLKKAVRSGVFEASCENVHCSECEELLMFLRHLNTEDSEVIDEIESCGREDSEAGKTMPGVEVVKKGFTFKIPETPLSADPSASANGNDDSPWSKEDLRGLPWLGKAFLDQIWEATEDETPLTAMKLIDWARSRKLLLRFDRGNEHVSFQLGFESRGCRVYPVRIWSDGRAFIELPSSKRQSISVEIREGFRARLNRIEYFYMSEADNWKPFKFDLSILSPDVSFSRFTDALKWLIKRISS